jgi:hypothetical protein
MVVKTLLGGEDFFFEVKPILMLKTIHGFENSS